MPLFDFRCTHGHLFESLEAPDLEYRKCRIRGCRARAIRVWVSRSTFEREAQPFHAPVVFKCLDSSSQAQYLFPGRSDEKTPEGYERLELNTTAKVRRFERQYSQYAKDLHGAMLEVERERYSRTTKHRRSEIERIARQGPPNLRRYAEAVLARMDKRDFSREAQKFESGFSVEAFSYNQSNRLKCDDPREMSIRQRR
jgi:hypothetical protein